MSQFKGLIDQTPKAYEAPLQMPALAGWRARRGGESERQRINRVSRSCCYCGEEFSRAGTELDVHEDQH